MTLRLVRSDTVHLAEHTFMWVALTRFAIEAEHDDHALLASVIAAPGYAHDYASPFDGGAIVTEPAVHGRWWRSSISPASFEPWTALEAEGLLQRWADAQDWADPTFRQPQSVQDRLQRVYALLQAGTVYHLINPGAADEHSYGFVTGDLGFHEFVVIDRPGGLVHVVVASDD